MKRLIQVTATLWAEVPAVVDTIPDAEIKAFAEESAREAMRLAFRGCGKIANEATATIAGGDQ